MKEIFRILLLMKVVMLLPNLVLCQGGDIDNLKNIVPPSPNASSLGKYGDWPVSLYTGVPNINIPIYTLKGKGVSIPISLSYHAAGNKVGEIASWVGLGWSLHAGGIISRSVKGLPDDIQGVGYFASRQLYSNPENLASTAPESVWKTHAYDVASGNADSEQDSYTISVLGKSYKLLFKADGSILTVPHSNLKITTNAYTNAMSPEDAYWTIITEDGTRFNFGGTNSYETNTNPRFGNLVGMNSYSSSWLLKSIKTTTGAIINFTYTASLIEQDSYYSESDVIKYSISTGEIATCAPVTESGTAPKAERQQVTVLNLNTIESDLCRMDFIVNPGERLDLKNGKRLDTIKVYSKLKERYIESYIFNYTYSHAVVSNELLSGIVPSDTGFYRNRLRLNSLEKRDNSGELIGDVWTFNYNPQHLPSRRSFAQDHWGFFNGATANSTLLPFYHYSLPNTYFTVNDNSYGFFPSMHSLGANREGDETSMKAEILTDIKYPTGGKTRFNYEANSTPVTEEQFVNQTVPLELHLNSSTAPYVNYVEVPFSITKGQYVQLGITSYVSAGISNSQPNVVTKAEIVCVDGGCVNGAALVGSDFRWFNLRQPGNYKLKVYTNAQQGSFGSNDAIEVSAFVTYSKSNGVLSYNKPVGGLRVRSIENFDFPDSVSNSKKYFQYDSILVMNPVDLTADYISEQVEQNCIDHGESGIEQCIYQIVRRSSSTKFSLGSIQGGGVGYGRVTTFDSENGDNGKTVSEFYSEPDANVYLSKIFPFPSPESREWRRGLLKKETLYNVLNQPVSETANTYEFNLITSITNFKAGYQILKSGTTNVATSPCHCTDIYHYCDIQRVFYQNITEQVKLTSTSKTVYDNGQHLVSTTNYFYDNPQNLQATRTETVNSKGDSLKVITKTAMEKENISTSVTLTSQAIAAIDTMLQKNIISVPILTEKYRNNMLIERTLTNYKNWNGGIIQPSDVQFQKGAAAIESRVLFTAYDDYGNLLEQSKKNDVKSAYLYDYANTYPMASVLNAGYGSIAATSFESDGKGNWGYLSAGNTALYGSVTGNKAYTLGTGNITRAELISAQIYIISFWVKDGSGSVNINNGGGGTVLLSRNGWTLYQRQITGVSTIEVSGTAVIDELRLFPVNAQMTTYTTEPLIGVTSITDPNNNTIHYEYDALGRLKLVRDQDGNIIKTIDYNYKK